MKQTPTYPWCMVGTYKASTCAGESLITGRSLRPNHPQISGAWIAPAWWPIVISANQGNTSSRIQYSFSFAAEARRWMNILGVFNMLWHNFEINKPMFELTNCARFMEYLRAIFTSLPPNIYISTSASRFDDT